MQQHDVCSESEGACELRGEAAQLAGVEKQWCGYRCERECRVGSRQQATGPARIETTEGEAAIVDSFVDQPGHQVAGYHEEDVDSKKASRKIRKACMIEDDDQNRPCSE